MYVSASVRPRTRRRRRRTRLFPLGLFYCVVVVTFFRRRKSPAPGVPAVRVSCSHRRRYRAKTNAPRHRPAYLVAAARPFLRFFAVNVSIPNPQLPSNEYKTTIDRVYRTRTDRVRVFGTREKKKGRIDIALKTYFFVDQLTA